MSQSFMSLDGFIWFVGVVEDQEMILDYLEE